MQRIPVVLGCVAILFGSGCGDASDGESEENQVRQVTLDWAQAFTAEDMDRACDLMTDKAARSFGAGGSGAKAKECEEVLQAAHDATEEAELTKLENVEIESVKVSGSTAEVVSSLDDPGSSNTLRKVDGEWLVDE